MATYQFQCVPSKHKFSLDIGEKDTKNMNDPEYKKLRPQIICPHPGCGASAKKGEIEDAWLHNLSGGGKDLEKARKVNREATQQAQVAAADANRRAKKDMVRLGKPKGPSAGTPQDLHGPIEVSKGLIESLNSKKPEGYN